MAKAEREQDHTLENLLELDGDTFFIDDQGHWVKFEVRRVPVSRERPHGIEYSLTLHNADNERIAGFDNAHAVRKSRGPGGGASGPCDHHHRYETVKRYQYQNAAQLITDFWDLVERVLREEGGKP